MVSKPFLWSVIGSAAHTHTHTVSLKQTFDLYPHMHAVCREEFYLYTWEVSDGILCPLYIITVWDTDSLTLAV